MGQQFGLFLQRNMAINNSVNAGPASRSAESRSHQLGGANQVSTAEVLLYSAARSEH